MDDLVQQEYLIWKVFEFLSNELEMRMFYANMTAR